MVYVRLLVRFAVYVILPIVAAPTRSFAQNVYPEKHPNHYILLIDASGSVVATNAKRKAYYTGLTDVLLPTLYQEGFGENIPHFDPKRDVLTLLHFGIVSKGQFPAYLRLRDYSLTKQYIHPRFVQKQSIAPEELRQLITPKQFYELTILAWAKQLALWVSRPETSKVISHRTFLIMLHNGISNEGSLAEEVSMAERWGYSADVQKVKELVNTIDRNYAFTDGKGKRGWGWQKQLRSDKLDGQQRIFIEAYEVVSTAWAKWEADAEQLAPFAQLRLRWTRESGDTPEAILRTVTDERFLGWLRLTENEGGSLALMYGNAKATVPWKAKRAFEVPVSVSGGLTCAQNTYTIILDVPISQSDSLLGSRTVHYTYRQFLLAPLPFRCTLLFVIQRGVEIAILAFGFMAVIYYLYFRFYFTHIQVRLPGLVIPVQVKRTGTVRATTPVSPKLGLEAFCLILPRTWLQHLLYRRAKVELEAHTGAKIRLAKGTQSVLTLPTREDQVAAFWEEIPREPVDLTLSFQQGSGKGKVVLSYPKGI